MIAVFTAICCLSVGCGGSVGTSGEIETQAIFATPNVPVSVDKPNDAAVLFDMWENYECAYRSDYEDGAYSASSGWVGEQVYSVNGMIHLSDNAQWGEWDKAFKVDFEPVFVAERVDTLVSWHNDPELYLELSDIDGKVLRIVTVQTQPHPLFAYSFDSQFPFLVEFVNTPWENDISRKYHKLTLFDNSNPDSPRSIGSISRSNNAPTASILHPTLHQTIADEPLLLSWNAADSDGDKLTYRTWYSTNRGVKYKLLDYMTDSTSREFKRLSNYIFSSKYIFLDEYIGFKRFESYGARFAVSVSDGAQSIFIESDTFCVPRIVPLFRTLNVDINETQDLGILFEDESVVLDVTGDSEMIEESMLFGWESSVDGFLGRSSSLLLSPANLSYGRHTITVTDITDSEEKFIASAKIMIR